MNDINYSETLYDEDILLGNDYHYLEDMLNESFERTVVGSDETFNEYEYLVTLTHRSTKSARNYASKKKI